MGKPKKRGHKFQYDRNRKKEWKKSKRQAAIECDQLKHAWDHKKSVAQNMLDMGLSMDANKTLTIPKSKDILGKNKLEKMSIAEAKSAVAKQYVVDELEEEASRPLEKRMKLSQPEVDYCIYMMGKYGEDYKKMARDSRNHYQDTPRQIKQKIKTFKNIPEQYRKYLKDRESSMDE